MDIWASSSNEAFLYDLEDTYKKAKQQIEDDYLTTLHDIEIAQEEIEVIFNSSVKEMGGAMNAVVPFSDIDLKDDEGLLPDALYIGKLYSCEEKEICAGPALLPFASSMATGFVIDSENDEEVSLLMQLLYLRLMLCSSMRLSRFSFVDLHSYGQAQKYISQLSEKLKKNIVNDKRSLDELLSELEQTIRNNNEKLIGFRNIQEYNKNVTIDKRVPYHFIFISHLHEVIDNSQIEHIVRFCTEKKATNAGVYVFFSVNPLIKTAYGVSFDRIMEISTTLTNSQNTYRLNNSAYGEDFEKRFYVNLECIIPNNFSDIINEINNRAKYSITFEPMLDEMIASKHYWSENSIEGISIPIGVRGMNETVYFTLSENTNDFFAMIGGRSGFGKTYLLHNIICNGSLLYSPEELEFYLIDCTGGACFNTYKNLSHARFVSITKQREYTDSALEYLVSEMYRRTKLFNDASTCKSIEKIEDYRKNTGNVLPQILVIIDELQVLLKKNDSLARNVTGNLEKLIAEGRKFGIKIVISTQSYRFLDLNTSNITLRIALNLEENESQKILGNNAATKLVEKGEAILKNEKKQFRFQCAYINEEKILSYVNFCTETYNKTPGEKPSRFVFDGQMLGDIGKNKLWYENLKSSSSCKIYIGVPSYIREEHEYFTLRKGIGSNLLICGDDIGSASVLLALTNFQFISHHRNQNDAQAYVFDFFSEGDEHSEYLKKTLGELPDTTYCKKKDLGVIVEKISKDLEERIEANKEERVLEDRKTICLTIAYIQSSKDLKKEGYYNSPITDKLLFILKNGADYGIHLVVYSYNGKGALEIFDKLDDFDNKILLSGGNINPHNNDFEEIEKGHGLIIAKDGEKRVTKYEQDPFVIYNFCSDEKLRNDEYLQKLLSILE